MVNKTKNFASLAKKTKTGTGVNNNETSSTPTKKRGRPAKKKVEPQTTKKVEEPVETAESKIEKRVQNLLGDFDVLSPKKEAEKLEQQQKQQETQPENKNDIEWLSDELDRSTQENNELKKELNLYKEELKRVMGENNIDDNRSNQIIKRQVIELFSELQTNYIKLGRNLIINPPNFINRMIKFFPFLEEYKTF